MPPELAAKIKMAPINSSMTTNGMSHHFFSWRENFKNSLKSDHMIFVKLAFSTESGNGEIFYQARQLGKAVLIFDSTCLNDDNSLCLGFVDEV